jgi:hypothetical protein
MEDSIGQELKTLATRLLGVTPHSAACERTFSILGWMHSKLCLEAMGKLYLYYVSHNKTPSTQVKTPINAVKTNSIEVQEAAKLSFNYYGEEDEDSYDASQMTTDLEVINLAPGITDRELWTTIKQKFDLHAVQPGLVAVPVAETEEVVEESARGVLDFNVHEIVSTSQTQCSQGNEHSYA